MPLYLALALLGLAITNADQQDALALYGLVAFASIALGWGFGDARVGAIALTLIPLALPFGDTNKYTGGDDTDPLVWFAGYAALESALLIALSAGVRQLASTVASRHRRRMQAVSRDRDRS